MDLPRNIYIVGAGGVTSYFLPAFLKTLAAHAGEVKPVVQIIDGDKLEKRNLERQLFNPDNVEENKAEALVEQYRGEYPRLSALDKFFNVGDVVKEESLIFVFVDNHPARRAVLEACDQYQCAAIIAANEYTDAQALWYEPNMRGKTADPRVRYPEILQDETGNPLRPRGCNTQEALAAAPQLAIANFACASHALQLFWFYFGMQALLEQIDRKYWPVEHSNNFNRMLTAVEESYGSR